MWNFPFNNCCPCCCTLPTCAPLTNGSLSLSGPTLSQAGVFQDTGNFSIFPGQGHWTAREEVRLLDAIEQYGYGNWEDIARHIETRTPEGKLCTAWVYMPKGSYVFLCSQIWHSKQFCIYDFQRLKKHTGLWTSRFQKVSLCNSFCTWGVNNISKWSKLSKKSAEVNFNIIPTDNIFCLFWQTSWLVW